MAREYVPQHAHRSPALIRARRDRFYLALCYLAGLMTGFEFGGYQYIFLNIRMEFGFSNTMMATVNALQTIISLCSSLILSGFLDRVNKRRLLCLGAGIYAAGTVGMLLSASAFWFFAFRIFAALGSGMLLAGVFPAMALIAPEKSTKYTNMEQVFSGTGSVLSPLLLSFLLGEQLNLPWKVHYVIVLALALLLLFGLLLSRPSVTSYQREDGQSGGKAFSLRQTLFTLPFLLVLFSSAIYMNMETGIMNYAREFFEVSGAGGQAGIAISLIWASMVVSRYFTSHLKRGKGILVISCFCVAGLAVALMICVPRPELMIVWAILFGLAAGPGWPTILGIGLEAYPQCAGLLSSINMMFTNLGSMLGGFAVGAASDAIGMRMAVWAVVAFAALGAAASGWASAAAKRRERRQRGQAPGQIAGQV